MLKNWTLSFSLLFSVPGPQSYQQQFSLATLQDLGVSLCSPSDTTGLFLQAGAPWALRKL